MILFCPFPLAHSVYNLLADSDEVKIEDDGYDAFVGVIAEGILEEVQYEGTCKRRDFGLGIPCRGHGLALVQRLNSRGLGLVLGGE